MWYPLPLLQTSLKMINALITQNIFTTNALKKITQKSTFTLSSNKFRMEKSHQIIHGSKKGNHNSQWSRLNIHVTCKPKKDLEWRRACNTWNVTKSTCLREEEAKKKNSELKKNLRVRHVADVTQCYLHVSITLPESPPARTQMQKRPRIGVQVLYILSAVALFTRG